jgi:hypothetical protein
MACIEFLSHGVPLGWPMGPTVQDLHRSIAELINKKFPDPNINLIIDATWLGAGNTILDRIFVEYDQLGKVDNLFILSLVDGIPNDLMVLIQDKINAKIHTIGCATNTVSQSWEFNTASILAHDLFPRYTQDELVLTSAENAFICYQNKPSYHRLILTEKLLQKSLVDKGILTLGKSAHGMINNLFNQQLDEDFDDRYWIVGANSGRENPYSLGRLSRWQSAFLCVVSETNGYDFQGEHHYITEKTWKPMIGLRPFVIFGNPRSYQYLEDHGFDTFEDVWPEVQHIKHAKNVFEAAEHVSTMVEKVSLMSETDRINLYQDLFARLLENKKLFILHAQNQRRLADTVFDWH